MRHNDGFAAQGLRVLAFAAGSTPSDTRDGVRDLIRDTLS